MTRFTIFLFAIFALCAVSFAAAVPKKKNIRSPVLKANAEHNVARVKVSEGGHEEERKVEDRLFFQRNVEAPLKLKVETTSRNGKDDDTDSETEGEEDGDTTTDEDNDSDISTSESDTDDD